MGSTACPSALPGWSRRTPRGHVDQAEGHAGTTRGGRYTGTAAVFAGATGVSFRLVDVTHAECDETNQEARMDTPYCP